MRGANPFKMNQKLNDKSAAHVNRGVQWGLFEILISQANHLSEQRQTGISAVITERYAQR